MKSPPIDPANLDEVIASFERDRRRNPDLSPTFWLPPTGDSRRLRFLRELIRVDLELGWEQGSARSLASYREEFPELSDDPEAWREIAFEEYRLRVDGGDDPDPEEYRREYGVNVSPVPVAGTKVVDDWELWGGLRDAERGRSGSRTGDFPSPGDRFGGFRLLRELGRGAFARVYLAEQTAMADRRVVIKLTPESMREAGTLARLQHTNIVPVYSASREGAFTAIVMPWLGSSTLADTLRVERSSALEADRADSAGASRASPALATSLMETIAQRRPSETLTDSSLPGGDLTADREPKSRPATPLEQLRAMSHPDAALWIAAELAEGLAHAHDRGVIHFDLKPANVLIADDGRPMILDFNLASLTGGADERRVGGTLSHMAPEQLALFLGEPVPLDSRADLYALGLMLHEMLTGRLPNEISGGLVRERAAALLVERRQPPRRIRESHPWVTPAVEAIVRRCLAPEPSARYGSAHELAEDLRRQLALLPLRHEREPSLVERMTKAWKRNPWLRSRLLLGAVVAIAAITVAAAGVSARTARRTADAERSSVDFLAKADSIRLRLGVPDPQSERLEEDLAEAERSLRLVGMGPFEERPVDPGLELLTPERRESVRQAGAGLLIQGAHAERLLADRAGGSKRGERLARALVWSDRAASLNVSGLVAVADRQRAALIKLQAGDPASSASPEEMPAAADPYFSRLAIMLAANRYRDALLHMNGAPAVVTRRPDYWVARGVTLAELGRPLEADGAFSTALALQPDDNHRVLVRRGRARFAAGDFRGASMDFDAALKLRPGNPADLVDRALARLRTRDFAGALRDLDEALVLAPGHTRIHFARLQARRALGDRAGEAADLRDGLSKPPGDEVSWIARGVQRQARGDAVGAIADFDEALKLNPASRQALQNKASVLSEKLGRPADAVKALDRLLTVDPDYLPARAGRAVLWARLGDRSAAHQDAREVLSREVTPLVRFQIAGVYALTAKGVPADAAIALKLLAEAFQGGLRSSTAAADTDLEPIRARPEFKALLDAARTMEGAAGRAVP
jgi:serine/threonine protein kinase/Flp pilus assembly protein TadD